MKSYIGTKLIKAKAMTLGEYNKYRGWQIPKDEDPRKEGYLVQYSDDYCSWSPKDVFEKAYLRVDDNPRLPSGVSIGPDMVLIGLFATDGLARDKVMCAVMCT